MVDAATAEDVHNSKKSVCQQPWPCPQPDCHFPTADDWVSSSSPTLLVFYVFVFLYDLPSPVLLSHLSSLVLLSHMSSPVLLSHLSFASICVFLLPSLLHCQTLVEYSSASPLSPLIPHISHHRQRLSLLDVFLIASSSELPQATDPR